MVLQYFIFEKDYAYLSSKVEVVCQEELSDISYHMCRFPTVIAFGVRKRGYLFP